MTTTAALVTTEVLPCMSQPCAGGGVRAWGVGEALIREGVQCKYFLPEGTPGTDRLPPGVAIQLFKPELLHRELQNLACDAVLFEQWQPLTYLREPLPIPIIVDLPGPLILEYYWRDPENYVQHIVDKMECLSRADYFLCAHERQRGYYDAWLTLAGIAPGEDRLLELPVLLHEMPRSRQGHVEDEPLFFWGGLFWPWQERIHAFEILVGTLTQLRRGQIVIVGATGQEDHIGPEWRRYSNHPHVSWLGNLSFSEYIMELKRAAVALDLSRPSVERRLSSDLRTGTALWAGTPSLVTAESAWAKPILDAQAGWVTDYSDVKELKKIVQDIALERVDIVGKRRGAQKISQAISQPLGQSKLLQWIKNPIKRDSSPSFVHARMEDRESRVKSLQKRLDLLEHEKKRLEHDLNVIRSNPLFRFYKTCTGLWKSRSPSGSVD